MRRGCGVLGLLVVVGCADPVSRPTVAVTAAPTSDLARVTAADVSILFVGNSHTAGHHLPKLVTDMIRHRRPAMAVYHHFIPVIFLEDVAKRPVFRAEIDTRPWKVVVLQAQQISTSGEQEFSRQEGIDFARAAREWGATVYFYPEWGQKGVEGDGDRQAGIYAEMARAAGVGTAPVPRAWDLALAERPGLDLYDGDGNHQSPLGAFLTAAVLFGRITGDSPRTLAAFPSTVGSADERAFLLDTAARALDATPAAAGPSSPGPAR